MNVISNTGLPIKSWCVDMEAQCMEQLLNLAQLPFAFKHIAEMPDGHMGYGMPIGGVLCTGGKRGNKSVTPVVIPNAVGVDIGCSVSVFKTSLMKEDLPLVLLNRVKDEILRNVPVGFAHRSKPCLDSEMPFYATDLPPVCKKQYQNARTQMGTLGGGNHFIEIQHDEAGAVYVMIHSGSRNLGKQVCDYYNAEAKKLNAQWHTSVSPSADLAFLPINDVMGALYMMEMQYCLEFSTLNHVSMAGAVQRAICTALPFMPTPVQFSDFKHVQHNYAAWENHFGENVIIHRKGATSARLGQLGIIPGSQGTNSYIVEGLGNPESFMSCSHGAGRRLGRKRAIAELDLAVEVKMMEDKGIAHSIRGAKDLDEAPGSYKNIDDVMEAQKDLVKIVKKLTPMGVVKG